MRHKDKQGQPTTTKGPVADPALQSELFPKPVPLSHQGGGAHMSHPVPGSKRLHRKKAAEHLGVSLSFLDKSRLSGTGPPFIRIGNKVVYSTDDLDQHMAERRHKSTAEYD